MRWPTRFICLVHAVLGCGALTTTAGAQRQPLSPAAIAQKFEVDAFEVCWVDTASETATIPQGQPTQAFGIGSVGKIIVAMGILKLEEQGRLHLDDPVALHLPDLELPNPWEATDPVRIAHLLEHSAGLDEMHFNEYYAGDPAGISLREGLARNSASKHVRWRPGTRSAYSNVGYAIAAHVIEAVTGHQAHAWLHTHLLAPMGMGASHFDRLGSEALELESPTVQQASSHRGPYLYYPALSMVATPSDLARMLQFLMRGGTYMGTTILQPASIRRMMRSETTLYARRGWYDGDYGLGLRLWGDSTHLVARATGLVDGYVSEVALYPRQGRAWAVLSTHATPPGTYLAEMETALEVLLGLSAPGIAPTSSIKPQAGSYRYCSARNALFSFHDDLFAMLEVGEDGQRSTVWGKFPGHAPFQLILDSTALRDPSLPLSYPAHAGATPEGGEYLVVQGKYFERVSAFWPTLVRVALILYRGWVYVFTAMLPVSLLWRKKASWLHGHLLPNLLLVLPYWGGTWGYSMLTSENYWDLGHVTPYALWLCALSLLVPLLSIAATWAWIRQLRKRGVHAILLLQLPLALGNLFLVAYLMVYGMLPFLSWSY